MDGSPPYTGSFLIDQTADGSVFVVTYSDPANPSNVALIAHGVATFTVNSINFSSGGGDDDDDDGGSGLGSNSGDAVPNAIVNILCFAAGTKIQTQSGNVAIEKLSEGDEIVTKDKGVQVLRWIGSRKVPAIGNAAPIKIKAGALGNDSDLMVSPQHRMLIEDWRAEMLFGENQVLAAAKHLVNGDTIYVCEGGEVEYFHMLFDTHEIVYANGAASESFHPCNSSLEALSKPCRDEVLELFPELDFDMQAYGPSARLSLKSYEVQSLIA